MAQYRETKKNREEKRRLAKLSMENNLKNSVFVKMFPGTEP